MRQFLILSPEKSYSTFQVRSYERFRYKPSFKGVLHMHAFSEIFFITDGSGYFHLQDQQIPIQKGMVVINNSNIAHTESASPTEDLEYAVLCIEQLSFLPNASSHYENTFFLDFRDDFATVFKFIEDIEWEWIERQPLWQYSLQTQLNSYILYILRNSNLLALPSPDSNAPNHLANIHLYLNANYSEEITLDKLASMFCMNKYYLAHRYKELYGSSIIQSLNRIRCETARNLLQSTNLSINEISVNVGYNSCSYFSKMYRKLFGETPQQTRNSFFE